MKTGKIIAIGSVVFVAGFAAVMAALNVDRILARPAPEKEVLVIDSEPSPNLLVQGGAASGIDFRAPAQRMLPSLVSIDTIASGQDIFGRSVTRSAGSGSGVIVSEDGYIVTNNHVVTFRGRQVDRVIVTFSDKEATEATIIGRDPRSDLAVLKVDKGNLQPIEMGDSDLLEVGEWVIAAGSPLGYTNTISVGIVSSKGRQLPSDDNAVFVDGIQTDAAINQGNSGGPLADAQGRLIGINVAIASFDGGSVGIGFAIPVNRMRTVVQDIREFGYVRYGALGAVVERESRAILSIDRYRNQLRNFTNASSAPPETGIVLASIYNGSAADRAGLRRYDVITEINGQPMNEVRDFQVFMSDKKPGQTLNLKVWSRGEIKTIQTTLDEAATASEL